MKQKKLLLNLTELAKELGVGVSFTSAMKAAGLPLPGGRTTIEWALKWLQNNPQFRTRLALDGDYNSAESPTSTSTSLLKRRTARRAEQGNGNGLSDRNCDHNGHAT
jgi:hypothetical protein